MRHRILFWITRKIDSDDRYYEWDTKKVQCMAIESYCKKGEKISLICNNCENPTAKYIAEFYLPINGGVADRIGKSCEK